MTPIMVPWQVKEARRRAWRKESVKEIAAALGITYGPVYMAIRGQTWSSIVEPPPVPVGVLHDAKTIRSQKPRTCINCGCTHRNETNTERCSACYAYLIRHGRDKDKSWFNGLHKRIPLSKRFLAQCYERYQAGDSIETICADHSQLTPETLRRRLRTSGYQLRKPYESRQRLTSGMVLRARKMVYAEGVKIYEVAHDWGIKYQTLYDAVVGKTWKTVGGLPAGNHARPCDRCEILTESHPSGLCAFCRAENQKTKK